MHREYETKLRNAADLERDLRCEVGMLQKRTERLQEELSQSLSLQEAAKAKSSMFDEVRTRCDGLVVENEKLRGELAESLGCAEAARGECEALKKDRENNSRTLELLQMDKVGGGHTPLWVVVSGGTTLPAVYVWILVVGFLCFQIPRCLSGVGISVCSPT